MFHRRRGTLIIVVGLAISATACADMMPASELDSGGRQSLNLRTRTALARTDCPYPFGTELAPQFIFGGLKPTLHSFALLPQGKTDVGQSDQTQSLQILTDGQGSFSLCLYALIGLGLCKCAPLAKKLSFSPIPQWYHDGGPFQVGHSFAISPDCLCSLSVLCFIQPDYAAQDISPEYYKGTIAPLLRKSLFTPNVLDPRGPPFRSC